MFLLENSFVKWLNRPYFDLGHINDGPLHVNGIEFKYRNLTKNALDSQVGQIINPTILIHSSLFRESLIRETGLLQYQVLNPLELPRELRTERWEILCSYLENYEKLSSATKYNVISLLSSLCFHHAVLEYVPRFSESEIAKDKMLAKLAYSRVTSYLLSEANSDLTRVLKELENIANHAPLNSGMRLAASLDLTVCYAKRMRKLDASEFWRSVATQELSNLKSLLDDFSYKRLTSIYYRAVVFVPLLYGNKAQVISEMDLCESLATSLIHEAENEVQRLAANENLNIILDSRTKEALWLKDILLAEERARKLVQREPLYSRHHLRLGEILLKQDKVEEARYIYYSAARLGPPETPVSWFMAGQCHERLGQLDLACDCYISSIQMDEFSISAVERLNKLAPRLDDLALQNWSHMRLQQLQDYQNNMASSMGSSFIPEASSELKSSGKLVMV
jgi:tetratricopeptide (TPR) repeat protein